jgi:hypothetical protein
MFNKTTYNSKSEVVAVTKEIHHTITPDKVTDVYKDVRKEVEKSFVRQFKIESDIVNGVVVEFINKFDTMERILYSRFILNGKEKILKTLVQKEEQLADSEMFNVFFNHYSSEVSHLLIEETAKLMKHK